MTSKPGIFTHAIQWQRTRDVELHRKDTDFTDLTAGRSATRIPLVECRGILAEQLLCLLTFMRKLGALDGVADVSVLNLYQVVNWILKPLTKSERVSYVEAITIAAAIFAQHPEWFISHWWGEAVADFVACVQRHSEVCKSHGTQIPYPFHDFPDSCHFIFYPKVRKAHGAYWVCAYANNQHELGTELGVDPMESSFLKATMTLNLNYILKAQIWCKWIFLSSKPEP